MRLFITLSLFNFLSPPTSPYLSPPSVPLSFYIYFLSSSLSLFLHGRFGNLGSELRRRDREMSSLSVSRPMNSRRMVKAWHCWNLDEIWRRLRSSRHCRWTRTTCEPYPMMKVATLASEPEEIDEQLVGNGDHRSPGLSRHGGFRLRSPVAIFVHNSNLFFSLPAHLSFSLSDSQSDFDNNVIVYSPMQSHLLGRRSTWLKPYPSEDSPMTLRSSILAWSHHLVIRRYANSYWCKHHRRWGEERGDQWILENV